jgi:hypothetical protein
MASPATAARSTGDDATPERLRHAREAGVSISKAEIYTPSGQRTGQKRRQLEHPIDSAFRRGWITNDQHAAGCRIRELMDFARTNPRVTSRYLAAVDGESSAGASVSDRRAYYEKIYINAKAAIRDREREQFVFWLEDCEIMDMNVAMLGEWFTPRKSPDAVNEAGIIILSSVLTDLQNHFNGKRKTS